MRKAKLKSTVFVLFMSGLVMNAQIPEFVRIDTGTLVKDLGNSQGSALADLDNDGDIDLLIGNSSGFSSPQPVLLYKNERNGNFSRIKTGDLATQFQSQYMPTATFADVDNDGDWDVTTPCVFYMNDGYGIFSKEYLDPESGEGCDDQIVTWVDINLDGHLDFYIWRQFWNPNTLYISNGDGTYTEVLDDPLATTNANTETISWADIDNDGDPDAFLSNLCFDYQYPVYNRNLCFLNEGGSFSPMAGTSALLQDVLGSAGASWGDYDNDGYLDLYVSTMRGTNHLYRNRGGGNFVQHTIDPEEAFDKGFLGSAWGDFDNDGDLDLFVTSDQNNLFGFDIAHFNMLFENNGDGSFTEVASGNLKEDGGHSCTLLDYDNDGDLDILVPNGSLGNPKINYIYSNEGNNNNWVNFTCHGITSNASAIGTRIYLKATINEEQIWQMREMAQETGLHSVSSPRFHFGLGDAEVIDSLIIRWPSGLADTYVNVQCNQFYRAIEDNVLELDLSASNYIEYVPVIEDQLLSIGESVSINLVDHFRFVTGDSVPKITGDTLQFTLMEDADPDILTSSLEGSVLTLQAGEIAGNSAAKIKVTTEGFMSRIDFIPVKVDEGEPLSSDNSLLVDERKILVYPNPAVDKVSIIINTFYQNKVNMKLFDISGKVIYSEIIKNDSNNFTIDVSGLEKGIYFIEIGTENYVIVKKLIKE